MFSRFLGVFFLRFLLKKNKNVIFLKAFLCVCTSGTFYAIEGHATAYRWAVEATFNFFFDVSVFCVLFLAFFCKKNIYIYTSIYKSFSL